MSTKYSNVRNNAKSNYFHFRKDDKYGKVQNGGYTLAWREMGEYLVYAVSLCSAQDAFVKKTGRDFCDTRLDAVSLSEEGAIQIPLSVEAYVTPVHIDDVKEVIIELGGLSALNLNKAHEVLKDLKLCEISYSTSVNVFDYINLLEVNMNS